MNDPVDWNRAKTYFLVLSLEQGQIAWEQVAEHFGIPARQVEQRAVAEGWLGELEWQRKAKLRRPAEVVAEEERGTRIYDHTMRVFHCWLRRYATCDLDFADVVDVLAMTRRLDWALDLEDFPGPEAIAAELNEFIACKTAAITGPDREALVELFMGGVSSDSP